MKRLRLFMSIMRRSSANKVVYAFIVNVFLTGLLVTLAEPGIDSYGDGLWFTFVSCTSIGYGDFTAVTLLGRILTVQIVIHEVLMVAILPGVMVSYYMEVIHRREKESVTLFLDKLEHLPDLSKEELKDISKKIKKIR